MKVFLFLLGLIFPTIVHGQLKSFKLNNPKDEDLENVLIMHAGIRDIDSLNKEIRIWTGSDFIQLEIQASGVLKGQLTSFAFAIDKKEVIRKCYYTTQILPSKLTSEIIIRLNEIDSIPSRDLIQDWKTVLDGNYYAIETIEMGSKSIKSYYALFSQTSNRADAIKEFFQYLKKNIFNLRKINLPKGEYVSLDRSIVIGVL